MAVMSDGSYGMPEGVVYSFPIQIGTDRSWKVVQGLPISDFAREKMEKTAKELVEEKETALAFLQSSSWLDDYASKLWSLALAIADFYVLT